MPSGKGESGRRRLGSENGKGGLEEGGWVMKMEKERVEEGG